MIINSLEQMETIVENNKFLTWDGWDVIDSKLDPTGWMNKNGAFIKGKWYIQKRYSISERGWDIPNKLARTNAK